MRGQWMVAQELDKQNCAKCDHDASKQHGKYGNATAFIHLCEQIDNGQRIKPAVQVSSRKSL